MNFVNKNDFIYIYKSYVKYDFNCLKYSFKV